MAPPSVLATISMVEGKRLGNHSACPISIKSEANADNTIPTQAFFNHVAAIKPMGMNSAMLAANSILLYPMNLGMPWSCNHRMTWVRVPLMGRSTGVGQKTVSASAIKYVIAIITENR